MNKGILGGLLMSVLMTGVSMGGDMDKTEWKMREKGIKGALLFWRTDVLKFDNGQFTSMECVPYGFNASVYSSTKEGDKVNWSAIQTNSKGDKMEWKGTEMKNRMEGTFVWTTADGKTKTCSWKACPKS